MDKKQLPDFLIIPSEIILDQEMQTLDGYVYGIVYWFTKQKLEKCIASNQDIADRLGASASGVAHSLSRLNKGGYIEVVLGEHNQRIEIIPLVSFKKNKSEPLLKRATPLAQTSNPPCSNEQHNNNTYKKDLIIEKEINKEKGSDIAIASPLPSKKPIIAYKEMEALGEPEFEEIANRYGVPIDFVRSKAEDMWLWAGQQPLSKKLQNRNWKLTLMNWVKRDKQKLREEVSRYARPTVDARGLSKRI